MRRPVPDDGVPHPQIPDWLGEGEWTPPGTPPTAFAVWATDDDDLPLRITHHRDLLMSAAVVEQDYDFISYHFGDPAAPIVARHSLGDREVSVTVPTLNGRTTDIEQARTALPKDVLDYLRKRFEVIRVLTDAGYVTIWPQG